MDDRGISKTEAGQMDTSIGWFNRKYEECEYIAIMIHPSKKYKGDADSSEQLHSIQSDNLEKLKNNVLRFYRSFSGVSVSSISPEDIIQKIKTYVLDSDVIEKTIILKVSK